MHVLCYGITPDDHEWLQAHSDDVEGCAEYLHANEITAALAHPFYAVEAPLTARHRRRLAQLFPIWETRNGSRAKELNLPAFVYIETHGGTAIGGSDDHAGIDIGRTFTETPAAATPAEFLAHIRAGDGGGPRRAGQRREVDPRRDGARDPVARAGRRRPRGPTRRPCCKIVERVIARGRRPARRRRPADLGPDDAIALLRAWLVGDGPRHRRARTADAAPGR